MGVCLYAPAPPLKERDDGPLPQRQGKTIGGAGSGDYGNRKSKCPYPDLAWPQKSRSGVLFSADGA